MKVVKGEKREDILVVGKEKADTKERSSKNEKTETYNDIMEGRCTDWYSIYMTYIMSFLSGIQLTIYYTSVWPYLLSLNPSSNVNLLGYVIASFSLGLAIGSPLFGGIATKLKSNKIPIIIGLIIVIIGNIIYAFLPNLPKDDIFIWICLSRILVGFGSGTNGVLRSYCVTACIQSDRRRVVALSIASFVMGVTVGPVLQAVFTPLGTNNNKFLIFTINMFTMPALIMAIIYIFGIGYFWLKFKETFIGFEIVSSADNFDECEDNIKNGKIKNGLPKYDKTGVIVCIAVMFVQASVSTNLEAVATPLAISMYNWNDAEAVLYNGLLIAASAVISFGNYMMQAFTFVHKIDQRKLLIFGLSVFFLHHTLNYPWTFYPDKLDHIPIDENGTEYSTAIFGGCSKNYEWCNYINRVPLIIYCITMIVCLGFGFPYTAAPNSTLYADILGPRRQGFMQGIFELFGSIARMVGPLIGTYLFNISGPVYVMMLQGLLILFAILLILIFYQRLIPLKIV